MKAIVTFYSFAFGVLLAPISDHTRAVLFYLLACAMFISRDFGKHKQAGD